MLAGRSPSESTLGPFRAYVDQDDADAVAGVLLDGTLTQGRLGATFEAGLAQATGASHAVAVSSGTAALHLVYHALGVGPGRVVWTSANAGVATASAAQMCGGAVRFLDIDPRTGNLDLRRFEARLAERPAPYLVTATHFAGLPCDMEWLIALKRRHDFLLVEDAGQALGARYRVEGRWYRVGEHPELDASVLSFHPRAQLTTAEGGAVLTSSASLAARLARLRNHGLDADSGVRPFSEERGPLRPTPWFEPVVELGFNHRLSELHAALGASQLRRLPDFLAARREIAFRYLAELRGFGLPHPGGVGDQAEREHAWNAFVVRCQPEERDELLQFLRPRGILGSVDFYPLPLHPWFRARSGGEAFPHACDHARTALSLPLYPALSESDQARVIDALHAWRRERQAA